MGDIICKWRVANVENLLYLIGELPHEVMPNQKFRDKMGVGFMRTPYQLACQLGLYYIDDNDNYIPRFTKSISKAEAEAYLHKWILRYYAPNPYAPSFRKDLTDPIALVPALVEYVEEHPDCLFEDACNAIYGEKVGNTSAILNAIKRFSKVLDIDRNHIVKLLPNYKEILMADRLNKEEFFLTFNAEAKKPPLDESLQIIFYGAPGTGKSHRIDNDSRVTDDNTIRTTFHPDTDYSTFVGAYKPTMDDVPVNAIVGTTVHHAKRVDNEKVYEKKIVYKYVPQAFLKAYVAAWSDLDKPFFLVIEEINRGNCAQIFGDLFQLLDRNNTGSSSYSIHADEDIARFLAEDEKGFANLAEEKKEAIRSFVLVKDSGKTEAIGKAILSGEKLLLPPNLYIWATMNTSDQSLFPIDSAFKRRWNWEYIPIDYYAKDWQFQIGEKRYSWSDFLLRINPLIYTLTQSSDKQMGYFFAKADKKTDDSLKENNLISEKVFLNKVLFYLWNDVFKDFEPTDPVFYNDATGRMYQFDDFFPTENGNLAEFVSKLALLEEQDSGHTFTVDGEKKLSMIETVLAVLQKYFEKNPDISTEDAIAEWNGFGLPKHVLETEETFNARTDMYKNRSKTFTAPDDRKFYVANQLRPEHMDRLANKAKDWGIDVIRVS